MYKNKIIDESELKQFMNGDSLAERTKALFKHQLLNCNAVTEGYKDLESVQVKEFQLNGFPVRVQFNPGRIKSTSAKVDKKSIEKRPCFLCAESLLEGQVGIEYYKDFIILVNPFPIYEEHFTVPKVEHLPQLIKGKLGSFLDLAKELNPYYSVLYNGPECGASAPDHSHFQLGNAGFLPLESDYERLKGTNFNLCLQKDEIVIYRSKNYFRRIISLESENKGILINYLNKIIGLLEYLKYGTAEPMLNILGYYKEGKWIVHVFPRKAHRPKQYFLESDSLMISPATIDMSGVMVAPREEDFNKISEDDIIDIYRQVTLPKEAFDFLIEKLKS